MLDEIDGEGSVTNQTALQAFNVAFGPLPGVTQPEGTSEPVLSGTLALHWAALNWSGFSPEQQGTALDLAPELAELVNEGTGNKVAPRTPVNFAPGADEKQAEAESLFTFFLGKTRTADPGWRPTVKLSSKDKKNTLADAVGDASHCTIVLTPSLLDSPRFSSSRHAVLAHEVFHCVQDLASDGIPSWAPWITEGSAVWAAEQAPVEAGDDAGRQAYYDFVWSSYLQHPERSMFSRAYNAFGFYVYLQQKGVDLWSKLTRFSPGSTNSALFDFLVGDVQTLKDWPSGFFRDSSLGDAWDTKGPGITAMRPPAATAERELPDEGIVTMTAPSAGSNLALINPTADVVTLTASGVGHLLLGDGTEVPIPATNQTYCARHDGCVCPPESATPGPRFPNLAEGLIHLGITGGTAVATATLTGRGFDPQADCTTLGPLGHWSLSEFEITSSDSSFSVLYTPTGGSTSLTVNENETALIDMNGALFSVESTAGMLPGSANGDGHAGAKVHFNPSSSQLTWTSNAGDTGFSIGVEGHSVSSDELPGQENYQFPALMSYTLDEHTMVWRFAVDDGEGRWVWRR